MRQSIGFELNKDLHLYGTALSQWSGQIVRNLELLINSYADAYRMQIHRFRGTSDLEKLRDEYRSDTANWGLLGHAAEFLASQRGLHT